MGFQILVYIQGFEKLVHNFDKTLTQILHNFETKTSFFCFLNFANYEMDGRHTCNKVVMSLTPSRTDKTLVNVGDSASGDEVIISLSYQHDPIHHNHYNLYKPITVITTTINILVIITLLTSIILLIIIVFVHLVNRQVSHLIIDYH